jgi:hypothetical protein
VPYHVYYSRKGSAESCPFAQLDVDDTTAYGPETVTIRQRITQGTYVYAIYNYSGFPAITESGAQVQVFDSTGLLTTLNVPVTGEGRWWNVLTIDGATGAISEVNTITGDAAPYGDTTLGCDAP